MLSTSRPSIALLAILMTALGVVSLSWKADLAAAMIQVVAEEPEVIPVDEDELDDDLPLDIPLDRATPSDKPENQVPEPEVVPADEDELDDDLPLDIPLDRATPSDKPENQAPEPEDDSSPATLSTPAPKAESDSGALSTEVDRDLPTASLDFLFEGKSPSSLDELKAMEKHFASLAEQVSPATVNIQMGTAQGSGVVVSEDGYILTAAHVIGRPSAVASITFPDGRTVKADTLGLARQLDYGMLKIQEEEGDDFPHLDIGLSAELQPGQWVMAIGHPGGIDKKRGLVFRAGRIIDNAPGKLQTDCTLVGGDSGGPLVDMNGEVIGIHSRIGSRLWDNLHAPIDVYSDHWDQMDRGVVIDGNPYMGFTVRPNSNRISDVKDRSPAEKAGIKPMDRIIEINGTEIETYNQLELAIAKLLPYQKTTLKIKRRSKTLSFDLIVGENN